MEEGIFTPLKAETIEEGKFTPLQDDKDEGFFKGVVKPTIAQAAPAISNFAARLAAIVPGTVSGFENMMTAPTRTDSVKETLLNAADAFTSGYEKGAREFTSFGQKDMTPETQKVVEKAEKIAMLPISIPTEYGGKGLKAIVPKKYESEAELVGNIAGGLGAAAIGGITARGLTTRPINALARRRMNRTQEAIAKAEELPQSTPQEVTVKAEAIKAANALEKKAIKEEGTFMPLAAKPEDIAKEKEVPVTNGEVPIGTIKEDEVYVPRNEEVVKPSAQGELYLEPLPPETLTKFKNLGYEEADLVGRPDAELIDILEKGKRNDQKNIEGISSSEPPREAPIVEQPLEGAGKTEAGTGRVLQAPEEPKAKSGIESPRRRYGQKITKEEVLELQRLGFQGKEIKQFKPEEARATIERVKNVPPPDPAQLERAEAAAKRVYDAEIARRNAQAEAARTDRPPLTEEQKAQVLAEVEKDIADVEARLDEPLTAAGDLALKLQNLDDPTLDALVTSVPKSREEIMQNWRAAIEKHNAEIEKRNIVAKAEAEKSTWKEGAPSTPEELKAYMKKKADERRRKQPKETKNKEVEEWEARLREEGLGEEIEDRPYPEELTFDLFGGQQAYERLVKMGKKVGPLFSNLFDKKTRFEISDHSAALLSGFDSLLKHETEYSSMPLDKVLHHPELFNAYPSLREIKVKEYSPLFDFFGSYQGGFDEQAGVIYVSARAKDKLGTIIHEIQHVIQSAEDFARGGNENTMAPISTSLRKKIIDNSIKETERSIEQNKKSIEMYNRIIEEAEKLAPEDVKAYNKLVTELRSSYAALEKLRRKPDYMNSPSFKRLKEKIWKIEKEQAQLFGVKSLMSYSDRYFNNLKIRIKERKQATESDMKIDSELLNLFKGSDIQKINNYIRSTKSFELYRHLAGEIEARDAASRIGLWDAERERTAPYSSEDIPIEDWTEGMRNSSDMRLNFDPTGLGSLYSYIKQKVESQKAQSTAPSKQIIAEVNGQQLTRRQFDRDVEGTLRGVLQNIDRFAKANIISPDYAYKDNPVVGPLQFDLHKRLLEGNFAASQRNTAIRTAESLLDSIESKEKIKGILEGKVTDGTPKEMEAARIIRKELDAVREKYKEHLRGEYKRNLDPDEFAALSEIIAGKPIEDVIAKYKEHYVLDKLGRRRMRRWIDEEVVRDIADDYKAIDSWGLDDYVTHVELGQIRIMSNGKLAAKAMSVEDAARKFADLIERDREKGEVHEYYIDDNYNRFNDIASGVSKISYQRIINSFAKEIQKVHDTISQRTAYRLAQKSIHNQFFIKPTKQYSPYVKERNEVLMGEKNVFDILYNYMYNIEKKMALDPAIDNIRKAIGRQEVVGTETRTMKDGSTKEVEIKRPVLRKDEIDFLETYVEDVKGRYYLPDKIVDNIFMGYGSPRLYSKIVKGSRELQANLKLGYAPVKGFINGLSGVGHIWSKVREGNLIEGAQFLKTEEGKQFIKEMEPYMGVNIVESATGELSSKGSLERILEKSNVRLGEEGSLRRAGVKIAEPLSYFQWPEVPVRKLTLASNYLMAKKSGMSEVAARDAAIKATWFQQFTYDMASLPRFMRGPTARLITQFKPYLCKEIEFITSLSAGEAVRYTAMQLALGGPRAAVLILKSFPVLSMLGMWDKIEEWMTKEYPRLSRGIPGFIGAEGKGVDVSAATAFQLPTTEKDWIGPMISDIFNFGNSILGPMSSGVGVDKHDISKYIKDTFPVWRYYSNMMDLVIDKDGYVKDDHGNRLYNVDNKIDFFIKSILNAQDLELSRVRNAERINVQQDKVLQAKKEKEVRHIVEGKDITDKTVELGIQPETIENARRRRIMDPLQRRVFNTELLRRGEVMMNYPMPEDYD